MELKKSQKADLENKRGLFLEIGLIGALAIVIAVFGYSQREKIVEKLDLGTVAVEEDIIEITRQDQKPPEPVKQTITVVSDIINVVRNDAKITTSMDFLDFGEDAVVVPVQRKEEKVVEDTPFVVVEVMPTFQGGDLNTFRTWVQTRLKYPQIAQENGIQGRVVLNFVIERDGTLTNINVLQSPDRSLSDEATRVLTTSPKWSPGKQRSQPVRVSYTLPVDFRLQN